MTVRAAATVALFAAAGAAVAQDPERRVCRVGRVAAADAPRIDGSLADACWAAAPEIGELVMLEPTQGAAPTQRTVIRLLHDEHNLYLALWCFDADPETILARQRARDAVLDPDDRVEILFDTFENRRTAYFFQVGAGGSIGDGLSSHNGNRFDKPWDTLWDGHAVVTDDGWQAELVIPFRSLPRKPGAPSWGFNVRRHKRSTGEEYVWTNADQSSSFFRTSELGTMTGLGEIDGGIGIDVMPFAAFETQRRRLSAPDWHEDPDAGVDLTWRLTPELTLALTSFTDFAQTENDSRQINLNRFPLFFPEKRDFFLEGSSYFAFGAGQRFGSSGSETMLPFFSRRIGLDSGGGEIPILFGAKMTGEAGPLEIGLLDVVTDETPTVADTRNLAVARLRYALAEETTAGIIATAGRPELPGDNTVFGVDAYHRVPRLFGDSDLQLFAHAVTSETSGAAGAGEAYGFEARTQGRELGLQLGTSWISPGFDPELGFVSRTDTRSWYLNPGWTPRFDDGGALRSWDVQGRLRTSTSWDGEPQTHEFGFDRLGVKWHEGDSLGLILSRRFERVETPFDLFNGQVPIAAGDYWTTRYGLGFTASDGREFGGELEVTAGGFFDGDSIEARSQFDWRASALFTASVTYATAIVDLPNDRDFTTHIGELALTTDLSPRLGMNTLVQYDNESRDLSLQQRLRWIMRPGSDLFVVLGLGWVRGADDVLRPDAQDLAVKVVHTLRF